MKRPIVVLSIVILLLFSLPVYAGPPLDAVQSNVNKVLEVLRDPKLKAVSAKEIEKEKLRRGLSNLRSWPELPRVNRLPTLIPSLMRQNLNKKKLPGFGTT